MPSTGTLDPRFRPMADELLRLARQLDARFVITSARRSRADQQRLYNRWRSGMSPFPAAVPGTSKHELGLAIDMHRLNVDPATDELLAEIGAAWREAGGVWGGATDPVHFQAPSWMLPAGMTATAPTRTPPRSSTSRTRTARRGLARRARRTRGRA